MYTLIGVRKVSFTDNGKQITGTRLFATFRDEHISGLGCESFWVPSTVALPELKSNSNFDVQYNKYGKVVGIVAL